MTINKVEAFAMRMPPYDTASEEKSMNGITNRRLFLRSTLTVGAGTIFHGATFAELLEQTVRQTAGPFLPDRLPLDRDNDLVIVDDRVTPAVGTITHVTGRVLTTSGEPVRNATVEIWQVDANGRYLHSDDRRNQERDPNFQGYGRFETATDGGYRFRTIRPVGYSFRTPHIHFSVTSKGRDQLTTQMYVAGESRNRSDSILNAVRDKRARGRLIVQLNPIPGSELGELVGTFDIVLG